MFWDESDMANSELRIVIVGGVAGVGVGMVGFQSQFFKLGILLKILGCWVISPVLTMISIIHSSYRNTSTF